MVDAFTLAQKRRILVTGASRGIGAAIATSLAADGHRVVLNYLGNHAAAQSVVHTIRNAGGQAEAIAFDVGDADAVLAAFAALDVKRDPFSIVVNNAGIAVDVPFAGMKPEQWQRVLGTSLNGFYNVTQPLIMSLIRQRWARVVNVVSFSGVSGNRGQVNYAAAKAGLIGATKALAKELADRGLTVNAVCPGLIETDMIADIDASKYVARIPLGRIGKPEEIAAAVRYLVSDQAGYVTGQVLQVGGGFAG
jgi:3-oxoacyl-[acyl-carrier protein] reductase